jgi:SHS2 domain-containing protein
MFELMACAPVGPTREISRQVSLDAQDAETLLVDWLSELLFFSESEGLCFESFEVTHVVPTHLDATAYGRDHHLPQCGIKAVTFAGLEIRRTADGQHRTLITFDV